ncbi:beta-lactamase hydrolase domain-containing protein [Paremcibacter congregatus]|uniref:beta-lactamase hydrolase domain-containing protein n=1 Tax=Paremcibacter congregatus TaxID=2043170 RepID=UPI0030EE6A0E|tara:strand:- start:413 stop:961 length:549 start_codon:yes stop_codon:yes gene_type:complete
MTRFFICLFIALGLGVPALADNHHAAPELDLKTEAALGDLPQTFSLHGRIYMAGQPDEATLASLKDQGFDMVINIRSPQEMTFDEQTIVTAQGLDYHNLPLMKDGAIDDQTVTDIHQVIEASPGKKILLHCSSGNRVAGWFGAHLARDMHMSPEEAIATAKQAGLTKASMEKILRSYLDSLK